MKKESIKFALGVLAIVVVFLDLALLNINAPFNHATADSNGFFGLAAENLAKEGVWNLKFGLYPEIISPGDILRGKFYTHHPDGFIFPTVILYKMFGTSEATTRLGPILMMIFALCLFAYALRKIFRNDFKAWLATLILAILPGFIFYGELLEISVAALAAALVSFSLFAFCYPEGKRINFVLFYISLFIGGLFGWFFYFLPAVLWVFVLFSKTAAKIKLLILMPVIMLAAAALNLAHFFWLNGNVISDLWAVADERSGGLAWKYWLPRIFSMLALHATGLFLILAGAGLVVFFLHLKKNPEWRIFLPLLAYPLLICIVFRQWVTHPFGVIYFLPIIAVLSAISLFTLFDFLSARFGQTGKIIGIAEIAVIILAGLFLSYGNLNYFFKDFTILDSKDIELVKFISRASDLQDNNVCLGDNNFHINMVPILEWCLGKKVSCADKSKIKIVLAFNPELDQALGGSFYTKKLEEFKSLGYKMNGCSGSLCSMAKGTSSPPQTK
jgi:4-amino-4-deoxy-L-arabinose transferase-like glycosyltransferase